MFAGHIQVEGEEGNCPYYSTQEGGRCTTAATQRWTVQFAEAINNNSTIGCRWGIRVVQQFHLGAKSKWHGVDMPGPSQAQQGTNQASAQSWWVSRTSH